MLGHAGMVLKKQGQHQGLCMAARHLATQVAAAKPDPEINLCQAVNDALALALETDPK